MKSPDAITILFDSARGIYIPQAFGEACSENWQGVDQDSWRILAKGPENVHYWDTWDEVLNNAYCIDESTGRKFTLYQDGDLFALCVSEMTAEEKENFGFEV